MKLIMEATRAVNGLPSGSSRDLYSAHASFSKVMAQKSESVLEVAQMVMVSVMTAVLRSRYHWMISQLDMCLS